MTIKSGTDECLDEDLKYDLIKKLKPYNALDVIREVEKIPVCSAEKGKTKDRVKSAYQEHISDCMQKHKSEFVGKPFGAAGEVMRKCADEWKKKVSDDDCALCRVVRKACDELVTSSDGKRVCEEIGRKLSKKEIDSDVFFSEVEKRLGITYQQIADKASEISEREGVL